MKLWWVLVPGLVAAPFAGCKARPEGSGLRAVEGAKPTEETVDLAAWQGGREGEVGCGCDGGTLVRYQVAGSRVVKVVLSRHADLESCVVAKLAAKDKKPGDGQCTYAF